MKKLYTLICFFLLSTMSVKALLPDSVYAKLTTYFKEDRQMPENCQDNYQKYQQRQQQEKTSFAHTVSLTLNERGNASSDLDKILIIVNQAMYNQITYKINRYAEDINNIYGAAITMESVSGGSSTDIKNLILNYAPNLDGVVFIGDIEPAWFEIANDYGEDGYRNWPCDLYYMDLNGNWLDVDNNGRYDSHTNDVSPEIFVGRISAIGMGTTISEVNALSAYLDRNHRFWVEHKPQTVQYGLTYTDNDWKNFSYFKNDISVLFGNANYSAIYYGDGSFGKSDYISRIAGNNYGFIQLSAHSSPILHNIGGLNTYSDEIYSNTPKPLGFNLFCCQACNWTYGSSIGFLGGSYIFNPASSALTVVGSTKTGGMLGFADFYTVLGTGKPMGKALKDWWINYCGNTHSSNVISWHYGMVIIGDPLVNFYHSTSNTCFFKLSLDASNNVSGSSTRSFSASNSITVNDMEINSNETISLSAPTVIISTGFNCQNGCTLTITTTGCQ